MNCYHCAEELVEPNRWQVQFDGELRDVCCAGCKAVMQAIVDANLGDYYRFRTEPAQFGVIPDNLAARLDELAVFDEPEISDQYLQSSLESPDCVDVHLAIEGLRCGACVWVLERSVASLPGVVRASVNYASARATVRFDPRNLKLSRLLGRIAEVGYRGMPFDVHERELSLKRESRVFMQRLFVAGIATMQVMMYALPTYLSGVDELAPEHEQLLRWASLVLTTPVLLYSAQPFLRGAWRDIRTMRPGMDVPVTTGILAAFFASVWSTLTAQGEIYFDSVAMFVFLLLGARYLEWSARRKAMRAVDDITAAAPETAQRLQACAVHSDVHSDGVNEQSPDTEFAADLTGTFAQVETVPAARLRVGDIIVVNSGERIPVDASVRQGQGSINNSLVTGESVPVVVGPGDEVAGGALVAGAPLYLNVIRSQTASTLSVIDRLIDRGASEKPRTVQIADRVATFFVSLLLLAAFVVWLVWWQLGSPEAATIAIAVLVVSCPCALSLATPAALAAATGELLRSRLLITRGHVLETLARVTDVIFDKTGTLTLGSPSVAQVLLANDISRARALNIARAMETGSTHPYALALARAAKAQSVESSAPSHDSLAQLQELGFTVSTVTHAAGHGVSAELDNGHTLLLGSASWCALSPGQLERWRAQDTGQLSAATEVFLVQRADDSILVVARFLLLDALRPEVPALIHTLKDRGLRIHLLSGDREMAVASVAAELGVVDYSAGVTPEEKQAYVARIQAEHGVVLMIGDGINDAPVLASADVSMAAGDATALARTAADVISLLPGLEGLTGLLGKSVQTLRIVRQNLVWAALYNLTAIPLAAFGYVPPWAAAIGMALSSLLVVGNAQRLWSSTGNSAKGWRLPTSWMVWNRSIS